MQHKINRLISVLLIVLISASICPIKARAATTTSTRYAWLVSKVGIQINYTEGGGAWIKDSADNSIEGKLSGGVWTFRNVQLQTQFRNITSKNLYVSWQDIWKGEPFTYDYQQSPMQYRSGHYYFMSPNGTDTVTLAGLGSGGYESANGIGNNIRLTATRVSDLRGSSSGDTYEADMQVRDSDIIGYKGQGRQPAAAACMFKFRSVNQIVDPSGGGGGGGGGGDPEPPEPEPEPEPEYPSEARVRLSIDAEDAEMNYMNFSGNVRAEAEAEDRTRYKDYGELEKLRVDLEAFDDSDSDYSKSDGDTVTASLRGELSKDANWLYGRGGRYNYEAYAEAYVQLDDGDPDYDEANDTAEGTIYLTNEEPSCSWNLQTNNINGGSVPNDFYYVGVPAKLTVKFSDPEDDINQIQFGLGEKSQADKNIFELVYEAGERNTDHLANRSFTCTNITKSINGYTATIVFNEPGTYGYMLNILDADSNEDVRKQANSEGNFLVRSAPEPPTAIISSPTYAFENEPFKVTQDSTDPNGVDDIIVYRWTNAVDVTRETSPDDVDETFKPITPSCSWPGNDSLSGKNGGTITFPTGSSHHNFKINLAVTDATNLSDNVDQVIRVISDVPVAQLEISDNNGSKIVKENRKITVNGANSLAPSKSPILWNECKWTIKSEDGKQEVNIHEDNTQRNGNKQRVLQFDKPGKYTVTLELVNSFSKQNPGHEDIGAATQTITIEVIEDVVPKSEVKVISAKPNFFTNPVEHTVTFGVNSSSVDGDKIIAPSDYSWLVYEDLNDDGRFTSEELVPQSKLTFNAEHTQVSMQTKFEKGRHNVIKAIVTTKETFGEPYIAKFLASNGSYIRKTTVETTEVVNWVPKIVIIPDQGPNPIPPDQYNPKPGTPYEPADIDGDGVNDGTYIRAYTDDTFTVTTAITDEFPEIAIVDWELQKKKHDGSYTTIDDSGSSWINSNKVTHTLGHDGGGCRIDSPGIYILKATVTDDCGDIGTFTVNIRIYTLPQAVLESNPKYRFFTGNWTTKENIRFDLRSDPTIVDDEWGVAWHRMYWDLDCWEITPLNGQKTNEIHLMTPTYSGKYGDVTPGTSKFTGKNSKIGGIKGNSANGNQPYRSLSFTEPGQYEFRYWGTNYGGKITVPVKYTITVEEDLPPNILGTVGATFYRDPNDGNRAKISLLGPYASILGREVLTIQSPDGDYIDYTIIEVIHDANNNKLFTDKSDKKWLLEENKTSVNGLYYILEKIDPFA